MRHYAPLYCGCKIVYQSATLRNAYVVISRIPHMHRGSYLSKRGYQSQLRVYCIHLSEKIILRIFRDTAIFKFQSCLFLARGATNFDSRISSHDWRHEMQCACISDSASASFSEIYRLAKNSSLYSLREFNLLYKPRPSCIQHISRYVNFYQSSQKDIHVKVF